MVYKLKIFIIPSNKKHTKLNPDGEYFQKSMIEEPKPKAKPKAEPTVKLRQKIELQLPTKGFPETIISRD